MPRNGSGVYTLPSGNPVVPGTTIDAAWANDTLEDMANEITNSLSRTGAGGMLAPFRIYDGTVTAPGLSFLNETNTGLYRFGSGSAWFSVLGVNVAQFSTVGLTIAAGKALTAQGATYLSSTLSVTGAATMASTLAVNGALTATGGVIGNLTGNVTAATGTSTFNNVTISGSLDMDAGSSATITGLSTPTNASDAANKGYVDAQVATRLALTGGTMTGAIAMSSAKITGLGTPTADADAATKAYVDSTAQGLDVKGSCRVATTANITLSGTQTIDGVAVVVGNRVLVKNQTNTTQNGIYVVASGAWTRPPDADTCAKLAGAFTFIENGVTNYNSGWVCQTDPDGIIGIQPIEWIQFSGAGQINAGTGMTKSGNTLNVNTASSSRIVVNTDDIDLATTGVTAGTYKSVTVDLYGRVTGGTNPTTLAGYGITDAYTQAQVDTALALKLNLTGGTMSGVIAMGANKITGLADPTNAQDAATKNYIDTIFGSTTTAAASAAAAASSASSASSSATAAASSATAAAGSATSAASSYTTFNNQYLGSKTSDPATNNTGGALVAGNLYWNSTASEMRVYTGSAWLAAYLPATGYLALTGGTLTGNLGFNGTGLRITGDFTSNATVANRLMFQSSTTNGNTLMSAIPNGTATTARWMVFNNSDPANSAQASLSALSTDIRLQSFNTGTGTLLPMTFYVGSSEGARISTGNNFLIGGTTDDGTNKLQVTGGAAISGTVTGGAFAGPHNGTVGATTPNTGAFTTLSATGAVTLSGGTANGVAYLNGSKVLTTGSALTFDGNVFSTQKSTSGDALKWASATGKTAYGYADGSGIGLFTGASVTGTGFYANDTSNYFATYIAGSEQMRLTSTGLGIGTSSFTYKLDVSVTGNNGIRTTSSAGQQLYLGNTGGDAVVGTLNNYTLGFITNGFERMYLDTSGNLGLGVTPSAWYSTYRVLEGSNGALYFRTDTVNDAGFTVNAYRDTSAVYRFKQAGAATQYQQGNGAHYFYTSGSSGTAGNAISFTQAMTLDASGNLLVGTTNGTSAGRISITTATDGYGIKINAIKSANTNYYMMNFKANGTDVGDIYSNGSTTTYATSSDYRLKDNIQPMTGALAKVIALKPVTYTWKNTGLDGQGFIAHELQEVVPDCVGGVKDEIGFDGNPKYQSIDTSFLVATLTAAIQEQQALIESLTTRLTALEGKA